MDRTRVVCGTAGVAAALLLAGLVASPSLRAWAGCGPSNDALSPPSVTVNPPVPAVRPAQRAQTGEKGIDELVAALESIKARKVELEKAERETVALLKEKLRQQKQRLQKLGIADEPETPLPPPAVVPVAPVSPTVPVAPTSYSN